MRAIWKVIIFVAAFSVSCTAAELKREVWHSPEREYEAYDSVLLPLVDFALIQKIEVGMTFEKLTEVTGFIAVDYHIHPAYALLSTKVGEDYFEVAFLHKTGRKIEAISFRQIEMKRRAEP